MSPKHIAFTALAVIVGLVIHEKFVRGKI